MQNIKTIEGGVCAAKGFRAGGIWCGIKASPHKRDLALIYSETACVSAAVFTTNRVKAAPVIVTQEHCKDARIRAVIANSGNANACTGREGLVSARRMASLIANEFAIPVRNVAVASTGVIGIPLPIAAIEAEISALADSIRADVSGNESTLEAIMTTDTRKKSSAVEINVHGHPVRIGAIVKGSGMVHPNMATMLCFITTDAAIEQSALSVALKDAVRSSFNRLSIDGVTSTNDMVIVMANGRAENQKIALDNEYFAIFSTALRSLCVELVRQAAQDGEGATKLIVVTITGARDEETAEALAKSVASSNLVKTAAFGADANWGRVVCALGYAGVSFEPDHVNIAFSSKKGSISVCKNGQTIPFSEENAKNILLEDEIEINISIGNGPSTVTVWGCDFSYDYVKINGDYRT
ncbi:MAG: bifunctional glutamate N-acetyltransferase/amino-acid acetyltransferase ArgJ [Treponema sp.]|jgi:glutamate N-acetyltransferase/amino-acid N-acetyltransferase|nr:bifunctional glutamate N-acetyltransferase/amino-acid acetyltransferase ArgJ [Treponema sp.]